MVGCSALVGGLSCEQLFVDFLYPPDRVANVEVGCPPAGRSAQAFSKLAIAEEREDCSCQGGRVTRWHDETRGPILNYFGQATSTGDNGGLPECHGLDECDGQPFMPGGESKDVDRRNETRHIFTVAGEDCRLV